MRDVRVVILFVFMAIWPDVQNSPPLDFGHLVAVAGPGLGLGTVSWARRVS